MATSSMLKAKGLNTFANYLGSIPEGSLFTADNVNIDRDGIIEPRRGIKVIADLPSVSKQLLTYKNRILAHHGKSISYLSSADPASITTFIDTKTVTMTTGSDIVTALSHEFSVDDTFEFTSIDPVSGIISTGVTYYVVVVLNENEIKISTVESGAPIVFDQDYECEIEFNYIFQEVAPNLRIKYVEMNGSLYVTTLDGIKKIEQLSPDAVSNAGGVNALDTELALDIGPSASDSGFFGPLSDAPADKDVEVAYSIVWGTRDVNNVVILGKPSARSVLQNLTGEYRNVIVSFAVPQEITENYFFQIYRTQVALLDASGAEFKQVYEAPFKFNATSAVDGYDYDPVTNTVSVVDAQPEDLRDSGAPLYTNEFSGEGILQANDKPPLAKDIAVYKNITFYANTKTSQKLELTFVGFDGVETFDVVGAIPVAMGEATITTSSPHGIAVGDYFALAGTDIDNSYQAITGTTGSTLVFATSASSVTQVDGGAMVFKSYFQVANNDETIVRRYYLVGRQETWELTCPNKATIGASSYFNITTAYDKIPYTFWIDKTGTDTPPVVANRVLVRVDISDSGIVSAEDVATKIAEVVEATSGFIISQATDVLTISTIQSGDVTDAAAGTVSGGFGGSFNSSAHIDGFGEDYTKNFVELSNSIFPSIAIDETARSLVSVINRDTSSVVYAYYLSTGAASLPGAFYLEAKEIQYDAFKVKGNNQSFGRMFNPEITSYLSSTNSEEGNALYFSKIQQPEAVPIVNKLSVGARDKQILRIIGLQDSLFILKEEGMFRLTGDNSSNFQVAIFDNSATVEAPDSAVVLNNQIYALSTQGVIAISETGVTIESRPIENILNKLTSPAYTQYTYTTFGVSYEADRAYILFVADNPTDTSATRAYRFNTFTRCWTSWLLNANCGVVNPSQNKLYLGPSDIAAVEVERKTLTSRDYADREFNRNILNYQLGKIYLDNTSNVRPGDTLTQTQYLTVYQYNRLVKKLKSDPSILSITEIQDLEIISGGGALLNNLMQALVDALNIADPSETYVYDGSSNFQSIRTQFNTIITQLNASTGIFFSDYQQSTGVLDIDMLVTSVTNATNTVVIMDSPLFIRGPVKHYKSIPSEIVWAPISLGDPSISKHVREGTYLIESTSLSTCTVGYASDMSGNFEDTTLGLDGSGLWGYSIYDNTAWGGDGVAYPIRTLIPRQKQRCRFIKAHFKHSNAFFKYSILGVSFTYEMMSERAWR